MSLIRLCVALSFLFVSGSSTFVDDAILSSCAIHNKTVNVHRGWPYEFVAIEYTDSFFIGGSFSDRVQLVIADKENGTVLFNQTTGLYSLFQVSYLTQDVHSDLRYTVLASVINKTRCEYHDVTLHVTDSGEPSCMDEADNSVVTKVTSGRSKVFFCQPTGSVEHKPVLDRTKHNFTAEWLHNCNSNLPNNTRLILRRGQMFEQLAIQEIRADDVGTYSCAVTYKGKTRIVRTYSICMQAQHANAHPLMRCDQLTYTVASLGSNLTINCTIGVGLGVVNNAMIATYWNKTEASNFECVNTLSDILQPGIGNNSRHSCVRTLDQPNQECFRTPPTPEQLKAEETYVVATLRLVNIQSQDLGTYSVTYESATGKRTYHNVTVQLVERSDVDALQSIQIGLGIGIASALLILLLLFLAWLFRFSLAFYWTRCFGGYNAGKCSKSLQPTFSDQEIRIPVPTRENWKRSVSTDSEFGMHPTGVERILSTATATTEVGSPDDLDALP